MHFKNVILKCIQYNFGIDMLFNRFFKVTIVVIISALCTVPTCASEQGLTYSHFCLTDQTSVHLLEVDPTIFDIIIDKAENGKLESVEAISKKSHALAAVNGGFFQMDGTHPDTPKGILKIDNKWHAIDHKSRGAIGWSKEMSSVTFDRLQAYLIGEMFDDDTMIYNLPPWNIWVVPQIDMDSTNAERWNWFTYIIGGAPLMISNGKLINDYTLENIRESYINQRHARTAVGILPNGHWVFVVVDGKKRIFFENLGITIPNLARLMYSMGCVSALNLDGGGSSTMVLYNEVVNNPCGEKLDKKGNKIRNVSNALLVVPKK